MDQLQRDIKLVSLDVIRGRDLKPGEAIAKLCIAEQVAPERFLPLK